MAQLMLSLIVESTMKGIPMTREQTRSYIKELVAWHGRHRVAIAACVAPVTVTDWMRPISNTASRSPSQPSLRLLALVFGSNDLPKGPGT